eukprot:TRINITY_DN71092_c0_g1_i1.p1 TRINITY_DN71092_c0_g1~~TRINITY_DN71092_c0_g1_i1.p1  ORF type:complete len:344 (+),score=118.39 TRINITY_DN71092_c0_g1_i1:83-1114(+)
MDGWQDGWGGAGAGPAADPEFGLTLDATADVLRAEVDELCDMLDRSVTRGRVYVRWLCGAVSAGGGRLLRDCGEASARFVEDGGLGQLVREEPLDLPFHCTRLAGSVTTFFAEHQRPTPSAVLDLVLCGGVMPMLRLRHRARDAMSEELLDSCDQLLELASHVLTHLDAHRQPGGSTNEGGIEEAVHSLLDLSNEPRQETVSAAVRLVVTLYSLSAERDKLYVIAQMHPHANPFGSAFISLLNRGAFAATAGAQDVNAGLLFAEQMIGRESAGALNARPSAMLYPSDMGVLAEVLIRELHEGAGSPKRAALLHSSLRLAAGSSLLPDAMSEKVAAAVASLPTH